MVWEFTTVLVSSACNAAVRWQWRRTDGKSRSARTFLTYQEAHEDAVAHGMQPNHPCVVLTGHAKMPCDLKQDQSSSG
jgi:hypothetical protein